MNVRMRQKALELTSSIFVVIGESCLQIESPIPYTIHKTPEDSHTIIIKIPHRAMVNVVIPKT